MYLGGPHRATRDIDLLGLGNTTEAYIRDVFTVCSLESCLETL